MLRASLIAVSAALAFLPVTSFAQSQTVDLGKFDGRWFEIERNQNDVQKDCSRSQVDFNHSLTQDRYAVTFTCTRLDDGHREVLRTDARVINTATNSKFMFSRSGLISVGRLAGSSYWVYDHAPDYSWAIMGLPDKSAWWIWHRDQNASQVERDLILARVGALGFSTDNLVRTGL